MNKSIIMCAYPGTGKTTAMKKMCNDKLSKFAKVIDLDSAIFKEKVRNPQSLNPWYVDYVNFAMQMADIHDAGCDYPCGHGIEPDHINILFILLSAHKEVREYLNVLGKREFYYVIPMLDRRKEWLEMAKRRADGLKGNDRQASMRAFMRISGTFISDITTAMTEDTEHTLQHQQVIYLAPHGYIYDIVQTECHVPY